MKENGEEEKTLPAQSMDCAGFILYCGLIGFGTFVLFFVYNACVFAWKFPSFRLFSFVLLSLSFIIWMKVATDLFFIYALFYCLDWKMEPVLIEE